MPKMKHPSGRRQIDVAPDSVAMYQSQGWQIVEKPATRRAVKRASATSTSSAVSKSAASSE